jgi:hypothetical protein
MSGRSHCVLSTEESEVAQPILQHSRMIGIIRPETVLDYNRR